MLPESEEDRARPWGLATGRLAGGLVCQMDLPGCGLPIEGGLAGWWPGLAGRAGSVAGGRGWPTTGGQSAPPPARTHQ